LTAYRFLTAPNLLEQFIFIVQNIIIKPRYGPDAIKGHCAGGRMVSNATNTNSEEFRSNQFTFSFLLSKVQPKNALVTPHPQIWN
jgi:hypothetical protein